MEKLTHVRVDRQTHKLLCKLAAEMHISLCKVVETATVLLEESLQEKEDDADSESKNQKIGGEMTTQSRNKTTDLHKLPLGNLYHHNNDLEEIYMIKPDKEVVFFDLPKNYPLWKSLTVLLMHHTKKSLLNQDTDHIIIRTEKEGDLISGYKPWVQISNSGDSLTFRKTPTGWYVF